MSIFYDYLLQTSKSVICLPEWIVLEIRIKKSYWIALALPSTPHLPFSLTRRAYERPLYEFERLKQCTILKFWYYNSSQIFMPENVVATRGGEGLPKTYAFPSNRFVVEGFFSFMPKLSLRVCVGKCWKLPVNVYALGKCVASGLV